MQMVERPSSCCLRNPYSILDSGAACEFPGEVQQKLTLAEGHLPQFPAQPRK
jgi:hypothetical protein